MLNKRYYTTRWVPILNSFDSPLGAVPLQLAFHNRVGTKHLNYKSSSNDVRWSGVGVSFSLLLPTNFVVSFIARYASFFRYFRGPNFFEDEEQTGPPRRFPRAIARYQYVITITQCDHAIMTWPSQIKIFPLRWLATQRQQQENFFSLVYFLLERRNSVLSYLIRYLSMFTSYNY